VLPGGFGRAAAVALSGAGADVAGIDIAARVSPILDFEPATVEDLSQTGRLVTAAGGRWLPHVADQRKIAEIRAVAKAVEREWGGVDAPNQPARDRGTGPASARDAAEASLAEQRTGQLG
jgi:NAD(P)-dependent dehydrogenase (short-subunit alcohol dehydrogenase family)